MTVHRTVNQVSSASANVLSYIIISACFIFQSLFFPETYTRTWRIHRMRRGLEVTWSKQLYLSYTPIDYIDSPKCAAYLTPVALLVYQNKSRPSSLRLHLWSATYSSPNVSLRNKLATLIGLRHDDWSNITRQSQSIQTDCAFLSPQFRWFERWKKPQTPNSFHECPNGGDDIHTLETACVYLNVFPRLLIAQFFPAGLQSSLFFVIYSTPPPYIVHATFVST